MSDDFIQYGERIRSPWEAKFWAYYWRREFLSQAYIKVRVSYHNKTIDRAALNKFYALAEDIYSRAEQDMTKIMKGEKVGTPPQDYLVIMEDLLNKPPTAENAKRLMNYLNLFAAKSGLDGETEKYFKNPWGKVRASLAVKNGDDDGSHDD